MNARTATEDEPLPFLHADRVVRTGVAIVMLFFVTFLGWAAFAPLQSAIITSGVIVADAARGSGGVSIVMHVAPEDADDVRPGMAAKIDLSANKVRRLPMLTGFVTWVSPQALQDPRSGQTYFLARLSVDRAALAGFSAPLLPGMPIRVEIPTGTHTALEYLIAPISDVIHNGMREK